MASKKNVKYKKTAAPSRKPVAKARRGLKLPPLPQNVCLLLTLWAFCWLVYGDVFYLCEQWNYFAFDKVLMQDVIDLWYGPAALAGKLLLVACRFPVLGGLVMALMLTAFVWLVGYIFGLKGWWRILPTLPVWGWMGYLVHLRLNIYFHFDSCFVFYVPLLALLLAAAAAMVVRLVSKRHLQPMIAYRKDEKPLAQWMGWTATVMLFVALWIDASVFHQDTIVTTRMQRLMQQERWADMIDAAQSCKMPTRPVAAYYAIALEQTDQLETKLFDIFYQFPKIFLKTRTDDYQLGADLYEADCSFYGGLVNTSYHANMEHVVSSGLMVYRLKEMALAAILNGEMRLAEKYLVIIGKMPFENKFVEKYMPMLYDRELAANDPTLSKVLDVITTVPTFEQGFRPPVFMGYYVSLPSGHSRRQLINSIMACLYSKDIKGVVPRALSLARQEKLAKNIEEGLLLNELKNPNKNLKQFDPLTVSQTKSMLNEAHKYEELSSKEKGKKLRDQFTGLYSMYYFYQQVPDDNYINSEDAKKGDGVN